MNKNLAKAKAIERKNREKLLAINPHLNDESGIYFLTRVDEDGIKYAYVGQALHITQRLCQHMMGYQQHIDLSIKRHKFYSVDNPYGWKIGFLNFQKSKLDEKEQFYIKEFAQNGYQLRNKTSGSQGEGKRQIDEYRPQKGYYDGLAQGRRNLAKELKHIIDTHLTVKLKPEKEKNKVSIKALDKFWELLGEKGEKETET